MLSLDLNMYIKYSHWQKTGAGIKQSVERLENRQKE
jgi:hypothetical protein